MKTRVTLAPPIVIGETTIEALVLRPLTCGDLFQAARDGSDGAQQTEIKLRAVALAASQPFAALRLVSPAVMRALEGWWARQWGRPSSALPKPVREPVAGDWFDADQAAGPRAGELEVQARIYALCSDVTLDDIGELPPAALNEISKWYDQRADAAVLMEEIEEGTASTGGDPSGEA